MNCDAILRNQRALALVLAGWTDVSGNIIYGFMLLYWVISKKKKGIVWTYRPNDILMSF